VNRGGRIIGDGRQARPESVAEDKRHSHPAIVAAATAQPACPSSGARYRRVTPTGPAPSPTVLDASSPWASHREAKAHGSRPTTIRG
jgi:hypothetical protein